jgi:hypothetical protein
MPNHGARTGRRTLASTSWLLLLAGLSCKYNVTLPWTAPVDAKAREPADTSFDQAPPLSPDTPLANSDTRGCPGNPQDFYAHPNFVQIVVAIDRSTNMLKEFDSASTTKTLAAWTALTSAIDQYSQITFVPIWFPWTNCGPSCCASSAPGRPGAPDGSSSCAPYEAGCLSTSNDSPSHSALQKASAATKYGLSTTVVLITDQNPSCAGDPEINACDVTSGWLSSLSKQPTRTFVLVPNTEGRIPDCFKNIAKQNPRDFPASQIIPARTSQELISQLDKIAQENEKGLCRFYFWDVNLNDIEQVRIGGTLVPRDGWQIDQGAIVLSNDQCKKASAGQEVKAVVCNAGSGPGGGPYGNN